MYVCSIDRGMFFPYLFTREAARNDGRGDRLFNARPRHGTCFRGHYIICPDERLNFPQISLQLIVWLRIMKEIL